MEEEEAFSFSFTTVWAAFDKATWSLHISTKVKIKLIPPIIPIFQAFTSLKLLWKIWWKIGKIREIVRLEFQTCWGCLQSPLYIVGLFAFSVSLVHRSVLHSGRLGEWVSGCGMFGRYRKPTLATVREAGPLVELGAHLLSRPHPLSFTQSIIVPCTKLNMG